MALTYQISTSAPFQPGKTWVVLDEGDGTFNFTLPLGFGKECSQKNLDMKFCRHDCFASCDGNGMRDEEPLPKAKTG